MNTSSIVWTVELVEEWICIAAQVERILPPVGPHIAMARQTIIRSWQELLWDEFDDDKPVQAFLPTNEQVSQWETVVVRWLPMIDSNKDVKILWWRACGLGWTKIGRRLGLERHTIANRHARALADLAKTLNRKKNLYQS